MWSSLLPIEGVNRSLKARSGRIISAHKMFKKVKNIIKNLCFSFKNMHTLIFIRILKYNFNKYEIFLKTIFLIWQRYE